MAVTQTPELSVIPSRAVSDTDADSTPTHSLTGVLPANTKGYVQSVDVDNALNQAAVHLKFYDSATPVVGTDEPLEILMLQGAARRKIDFPEGLEFSTAISFACVVEPGTAGTTNPPSNVGVRAVCR